MRLPRRTDIQLEPPVRRRAPRRGRSHLKVTEPTMARFTLSPPFGLTVDNNVGSAETPFQTRCPRRDTADVCQRSTLPRNYVGASAGQGQAVTLTGHPLRRWCRYRLVTVISFVTATTPYSLNTSS